MGNTNTSSRYTIDKQMDYTRASEQYVSLNRSSKKRNCCSQFIRDFPYSLFKQRRKDPTTKQHVLAGQKQLEHDFEERFWDFDNKWIGVVQYFHV